MPCQIRLRNNQSYVEATYSGALKQSELEQAAFKILEFMKEEGTMLLLADCSDIKGGHSVFDLYALSDWLKATAPHIKEAVVLPTLPLASENVKFWETTCRNRGLMVCIFNDCRSALEWLLA